MLILLWLWSRNAAVLSSPLLGQKLSVEDREDGHWLDPFQLPSRNWQSS